MIGILPQSSDGAVHTEETFRFLAMPELWQVALLIVPGVALFAWWTYGGLTRMSPGRRITLVTLRGLAIAALLFGLFQPAVEQVRYTTVQTQVHVLVDDSASMQRRDAYPDPAQQEVLTAATGRSEFGSLTRSQLVSRVMEKQGGLLDKLREEHDVRLFRFTREPRLIRDLSELSARGPRTHIGDAMELLRGNAAGNNLDALILVSDGRNNGGEPPLEVAAKYRANDIPIYAIGVGDPNPPKNVRIVGPPGPKEALRREEVAFDVTVSAEGLSGESVVVTLYGARDGGVFLPLATSSVVLGDAGVPHKVRMYHSFEEAGDYNLRFEVSPFPEETSHEDNRATRFLRVNDQKIRVLYLENVPRWEYRYVKNGLLRVDPSIETQVYLFDASKDFPQESSDHLPSLRELPRTREELFDYHVILIGDVPPERLGDNEQQINDWLELLVEFVEFGGGVGFMFGDQAMPDRYRGTPLEDLLPVVLEDASELVRSEPDRSVGFQPQLDNPAQPHDITLIQRDPASNARVWHTGFPKLMVYYPVLKAKAGAEVLLVHDSHENRYGKRVVAATSFYPRGRTFFLGTDETWRWRKRYGEKYHDLFWRNVARSLASGRLQRRSDNIELRLDKVIVETGEQVRMYLEVQDDEFQPSLAREFAVFFRRPEEQPERRTLRAVPGEAGKYQGTFSMERPGSVSVMVFADDDPAARVLAREDVLVKIPDREMAQSSQDREKLEKIAAASKDGGYYFLGEVDRLADEFRDAKPYEQKVDSSTRPLWDRFWILLLAVCLLGAEWVLRKRARLV